MLARLRPHARHADVPFLRCSAASPASPPMQLQEESAAAPKPSRCAEADPRQGRRQAGEQPPARRRPARREDVRKLIEVDVFAIEIGYGLLSLADEDAGRRSARPRHRRAQDSRPREGHRRSAGRRARQSRARGQRLPLPAARQAGRARPAHARPLAGDERLRQQGHAQGRARRASRSSISTPPGSTSDEKKTAELNGFTVVDPASVLITHLSETLKRVAHLILGRQEVQAPHRSSQGDASALVAELLPDLVNLGIIQRVLQNLLRENVAILNLPLILEGIADFAAALEKSRRSLRAGAPPARPLFRRRIRVASRA